MPLDQTKIKAAARRISEAKRIAVLTGAGVSKESGVPTFRDAMDGLWARFDPQELATPQAFRANPKLVWDWYEYRRGMVRQAKPNPGHLALAELQKRCPQLTLITQNVDSLHEEAGSRNVIHLHGEIERTKCATGCQGDPTYIDLKTVPPSEETPPRCPYCGDFLRPDVVWFGEILPAQALEDAKEACAEAEVMLVVGTSGLVQPAASLPLLALTRGASLIEVNPEPSTLSAHADLVLAGPSGEVLPLIVEALDHDS